MHRVGGIAALTSFSECTHRTIYPLLTHPHFRSMGATLRVLLAEGGFRGLWRGTGPTVLRLSLGAGINFVALEQLKMAALTTLPHASGQLGILQAAAVGGAKLGNQHTLRHCRLNCLSS